VLPKYGWVSEGRKDVPMWLGKRMQKSLYARKVGRMVKPLSDFAQYEGIYFFSSHQEPQSYKI
jgi:hypothetical protein